MLLLKLILFFYIFNLIQCYNTSNNETHLHNITRITFGGINIHGSLSSNRNYIVFEGSDGDIYGTDSQQIYRQQLTAIDNKLHSIPFRLSNGLGDSQGAVYLGDRTDVIFESNFLKVNISKNVKHFQINSTRLLDACQLHNQPLNDTLKHICSNRQFLKVLWKENDLIKVNKYGNIEKILTRNDYYDGMADVSADGDWVVYVSRKHGDIDIFTMKSDGSEVKQITGTVGFELNPVWSPDGTRILYAGFQPKMGDPYARYLQLLKLNFIDTTKTELFIVDKDGQNWQRLTNFNSSIWHPTWVDDKTVIFSSDYDILTLKSLNDPQIQFLYSFNIESKELVRLTENNLFGFDSFPTYDYNTGILIWTSNRIQQEKSTKLSYDIYMASLNQPPRHPFFVDGLHHEHKQQNTVKYHLKKKSLIYEGEDHFESLKQLTFGGQNAEGYFTKDDTEMIFQAMGRNIYGTDCDQIYRHQLIPIFPNEKTIPQRMSTGLGACTCSYLFPDHQTSLYAGSFRAVNFSSSLENGACPSKKCKSKLAETDPVLKGLCNTSYVWDIIPDYDIFKVGKFGEFIKQLTDTEGYDAEATISPDGKLIVYTSMASGDLDLWLMDSNGDNKQQITTAIGYDGGAFFSPDGTKLIFRASRPKYAEEFRKYRLLLSYDLVEPLQMELFTYTLATKEIKQITNLKGSNWAPYYLTDNKRIIFSSNYNATGHNFGEFHLYTINEDHTHIEKITNNANGFNSFPMMSYNGKNLIFGSSRNGTDKGDLNLFYANWKN